MMKRLRRLGIFIAVVLIALAVGGIIMHRRLMGRPTWYRSPAVDTDIQRAAANSMTQKLIALFTQVNRIEAEQLRARLANPAAAPATDPAPIEFQLSEDEINGFFSEWDIHFHWRDHIAKFAGDPVIILQDHELIVAATIKDWNAVASIHFTPSIVDGKLSFIPTSAMIGSQQVPRSYADGYVTKLTGVVDRKMPDLREAAEIEPRGWANGAAVSVAMNELLIHALNDEPAENVLFIPEKIGHDSRSLPVKITHIDISNRTLSLTIVPLNADERDALLDHLRGISPSGVALGK